MPFPVAKLGYLAVKQIAKPFANAIKRKAKTSPFLRRIIVPSAQWYHSFETKFKMRLMGFGKSVKEVQPLNEEMALELGAEMLGEVVIFSVGAGIIAAEYGRQARKEQNKEDTQNVRLRELEGEIAEMELNVAIQNTEIRELTRLIASLDLPMRSDAIRSPDQPVKSDVPSTVKDPSSGVTLQVQR